MEESRISTIRERYQQVLGRITEATIRSGRTPSMVHLVVVSKSQPLVIVQAALAVGISILGENYAEEAISKITALPETAVEWHMIGHVQSRKAQMVARYFSMLHSLDSLKLAVRLNKFCAEEKRILPVLLEVNVSSEESKFGFPAWDEHFWPDLVPIFEQILTFHNLRVDGLMTMPPYNDDPEQTRPYFKKLGTLQNYLKLRIPRCNWKDLSMGTSTDFGTAIEEGATYVRVGQAIFGKRLE
jgi:pyridoxal phosphate enzyme (YggS family)